MGFRSRRRDGVGRQGGRAPLDDVEAALAGALEHAGREVDPARLRTKSKNTPFHGMQLKGKPVLTFSGGEIYRDALSRRTQAA